MAARRRGRRSDLPWAWSMYLECQFATIGTALATGGYIAFLFNPADPSNTVAVWSALATVVVFFVLHVWGVKEQSTAMVIHDLLARSWGLVIFWCLPRRNFRWERIWTDPLLPSTKGWRAVFDALPYALWWLVIIDTVALAAEEAHEPTPHDFRAPGVGPVDADRARRVDVALCLRRRRRFVDPGRHERRQGCQLSVGQGDQQHSDRKISAGRLWFGVIAIFGMIASYHGMIYGTSRQAFALGRSGYLHSILGEVHAERRTPVPALVASSSINRRLRRRQPLVSGSDLAGDSRFDADGAGLVYPRDLVPVRIAPPRTGALFQVPGAAGVRVPVAVVVLSVFAAWTYGGSNTQVLPATAGLYVVGNGLLFSLVARAGSNRGSRRTFSPPRPIIP